MHRSGEDGLWTPCAHRLATSVISYDQPGFICVSLSLPVLFIKSPRSCASSTRTALGDWDSVLVVIVVGCTIIITSGLFFAFRVNE